MNQRRQALGRGLGALMGDNEISLDNNSPDSIEARKLVRFIPIEDINPNPYQPRKRFSADALRDLADSIKEHGILQPILVSKQGGGQDGFVLLAGERRFRAAQLVGLHEVPALVTEATDEEMLEIAIVENVQRDDLNPIEEAQAYNQLQETFGWSQEQVAKRVGKRRSTVANAVRLLKLDPQSRRDVEDGRLSSGHARALLAIDDEKERERLRRDILERGLSVRDAERRVVEVAAAAKEAQEKGSGKKKKKEEQGLDTVALEERLVAHLGCRVRVITRDDKSGKLDIPFQDLDELQRILDAIGLTD